MENEQTKEEKNIETQEPTQVNEEIHNNKNADNISNEEHTQTIKTEHASIHYGDVIHNFTINENNNSESASQTSYNQEEGFFDKSNANHSLFEYLIESNSLKDMMETYIPHSYDEEKLQRILDQPIIFIYGTPHTGRFTFAKKISLQKGFEQIHCFYEISIKDIITIKWESYQCYIIRNLKELSSFAKLYDKLIFDCTKSHCHLIFLLNNNEYQMIEHIIYEHSLKIEKPKDIIQFVRSHIKKRMCKLIEDDLEEEITTDVSLIDLQLASSLYQQKLFDINRVDLLVKLSVFTTDYLYKHQIIMDDKQITTLFDTLHYKKIWQQFIASITNIQEKLFFFVAACLNKFPKDTLYSKYTLLENLLVDYFSKKERKQIKENYFWSLPWSKRMDKIPATIINLKIPECKKPFDVIAFSNDYDKNEIFQYYLSEYDWYIPIKTWILTCIKEYQTAEIEVKKYERDCFLLALYKLAYFNYQDMLETMEMELFQEHKNTISIYTYAKLLRNLHDLNKDNIRKMALQKIHFFLSSKDLLTSKLGIQICKYGFYNIHLSKLVDEIINTANYYTTISIKLEAARCITKMICYQESEITASNSIFYSLCKNKDLYENKNNILVYILIYYLTYNWEYYWNHKEKKSFKYPIILFIFGKNIEIRSIIVQFFQICFMNPTLEKNIVALLKKIYDYVRKNNHIPNLLYIWNDFSQKLKSENQYCNNIVSNIELQ